MKKQIADHIKNTINGELEKNKLFLVDLFVSGSNKITVFIDSLNGVTIQQCELISRLIEKSLNRDEEDFELEVSSPGIDTPLKFPFQYQKNIGREVEVLTDEGEKKKGSLISADNKSFELEYKVKEKPEGSNKKIIVSKKETFDFDHIRSTKVIVKF